MEISKSPQNHYNLSCAGAFPASGFRLKPGVCNGNPKIPAKPLQTLETQPCSGNRVSPETKKFVLEFLKSPQNHSKGRKHTLKPSGRRIQKVPKKGSQRPESKEFRTKAPEQEVRRSKDKEDFYGT